MGKIQKFGNFISNLDKTNEEYIYNPDYKLNKYLEKIISIGKISQIFPIDNDLQISIEKHHGGRVFITYSIKDDKFIMGQLRLTDKDMSLLESIVSEFNPESKYNKVMEGSVAEPTVRPIVKPGIKQAPGKTSPLRKDRPSVVPGPKAVTTTDLADKFLDLTKSNNEIISLLKKKYNK